MTFPEGFWFGAGASATDTDGAAPTSDLGRWEHEGRVPPSGEGASFATRYSDDLSRFAEYGIGHLRHTLEWARLEPHNGHHDAGAVEHLRLVLECARDTGVEVWGCLHDQTLPGWFSHDERGFVDARSRGYYWARHVEFVGETFGDLIHGWVPTYEPSRWAYRGWIDGTGPPGLGADAEAFAAALEAVHLASVEAALRLGQDGQPVASAQWMVPLFPARSDPDSPTTADAQAMTTVADEALWGCWRRMLTEETLFVPGRPPLAVPGAREAFDVLGLTYRHSAAVRGDGVLLPYPQTLPTGPDGQVSWAEGLGLALHQAAESLPDLPLLVAGYGLVTANEDHREQYLRDGLAIAEEAVIGGIDLRGFSWDTPVDPVGSGLHRPGLFDGDRTARPAAVLLAEVARGGSVPS